MQRGLGRGGVKAHNSIRKQQVERVLLFNLELIRSTIHGHCWSKILGTKLWFGNCRLHEFSYSIWSWDPIWNWSGWQFTTNVCIGFWVRRFDLGTAGCTSFVIWFGAKIRFGSWSSQFTTNGNAGDIGFWELQVAQVSSFDLGTADCPSFIIFIWSWDSIWELIRSTIHSSRWRRILSTGFQFENCRLYKFYYWIWSWDSIWT